MTTKSNRLWNAFCTVHYFVTGNWIIADSKHNKTSSLTYWFAYLDKSLCTDDCLDQSNYTGC